MNHDVFYAAASGQLHDIESFDIQARIKLLATAIAQSDKTEAKEKHQRLVFDSDDPTQSVYAKELITQQQRTLERLGIWPPQVPDLSLLPKYSFLLQFPFVLTKPYISGDDEQFHICDNPVKKDKVFKVPMVSGSTWKGHLRWTAVRLLGDKWKNEWKYNRDVASLAERRFCLTMLFGDEKGEEPGQLSGR